MARGNLLRTLEVLIGLGLLLTGVFVNRLQNSEQNPWLCAGAGAVWHLERNETGQKQAGLTWMNGH